MQGQAGPSNRPPPYNRSRSQGFIALALASTVWRWPVTGTSLALHDGNETFRQQANDAAKETMSTIPSQDAAKLMDIAKWHTPAHKNVSLVSLHLKAWHTSKKSQLHA